MRLSYNIRRCRWWTIYLTVDRVHATFTFNMLLGFGKNLSTTCWNFRFFGLISMWIFSHFRLPSGKLVKCIGKSLHGWAALFPTLGRASSGKWQVAAYATLTHTLVYNLVNYNWQLDWIKFNWIELSWVELNWRRLNVDFCASSKLIDTNESRSTARHTLYRDYSVVQAMFSVQESYDLWHESCSTLLRAFSGGNVAYE